MQRVEAPKRFLVKLLAFVGCFRLVEKLLVGGRATLIAELARYQQAEVDIPAGRGTGQKVEEVVVDSLIAYSIMSSNEMALMGLH